MVLQVESVMKHKKGFWNWILNMINEQHYGKLCRYIDDKEKYLELKNREEARLWGEAYYKEWGGKYGKVMESAKKVVMERHYYQPVEYYCGEAYREINGFLRYEKGNECHMYRELVDLLSIVLCSAPRIRHSLILYRIVSDEFINMFIQENKRGLPIQEKGFMSTSLIKDIVNETEAYASQNNLLKIFVPEDTIGVYVNVVQYRSEEEILLLPNMYLGLVSYPYEDKETGKRIFECELIKMW